MRRWCAAVRSVRCYFCNGRSYTFGGRRRRSRRRTAHGHVYVVWDAAFAYPLHSILSVLLTRVSHLPTCRFSPHRLDGHRVGGADDPVHARHAVPHLRAVSHRAAGVRAVLADAAAARHRTGVRLQVRVLDVPAGHVHVRCGALECRQTSDATEATYPDADNHQLYYDYVIHALSSQLLCCV